MARFLYTVLVYALLPIIALRLYWRGRKQSGYRRHIGERFGLARPHSGAPRVWLHAVSVGEMRAAQPLVARLREVFPGHTFLITCMTPTGREAAESLYGDFARIAYLPYDTPGASARFLRRFRPALGLLMETELWPNLLAAARRQGVPVALVNARLSEKSARGYRRYAALTRPAFASLSAVIAQSEADARRLADCGATMPAVAGNLKFDVAVAKDLLALGAGWRSAFRQRPVFLAASTRDGEEALILDALAQLATPDCLLILVPRHPQRFDAVAEMVARRGLTLVRRRDGLPDSRTAVWLGDSMGEMPAYYAAADFAIIGGSLQPLGSQNLIEACACGCPVLVGPSDFNFAEATANALAAGAARRVEAQGAALASVIDALFADPAPLARMRDAARTFAVAHQGATAKTLRLLQRLVVLPAAAPDERRQ
jgi:3-deoxy-D-manno-octulosonic-acid transferase